MKPIIFSTDMVRAILDGSKTQTRRVIKPQPCEICMEDNEERLKGPEWYTSTKIGKDGWMEPGPEIYGIYDEYGEWGITSPYKPGDILWVRETWCPYATIDSWLTGTNLYGYKAGGTKPVSWKWRPSIFMPREAARLFLRVKDVRIERVQDITDEDALKEGCEGAPCEHPGYEPQWGCTDCYNTGWREPPQVEFNERWDARNAKRGFGWGVNPWVWVIGFERIEKEEAGK